MTPIERDLHAYIARRFLPDLDAAELAELTVDTPLVTGGILDPVGAAELAEWVRETFGAEVGAWDGKEGWDTIGELADLVGIGMICPQCLFQVEFSPDCSDCGLPATVRDESGTARCEWCHESTHGGEQRYANDPEVCPHCHHDLSPEVSPYRES